MFLQRIDERRHGAGGWSRITMSCVALICAVACATSLGAAAAFAQHTSHPLLRGMVVDPKRAPLANALVTAVDTATKAVFKVHTDSTGEYAFQGLSAGVPYLILVRKPGFMTTGARATLHPADTLDLDVMLARDTSKAVASRLRGSVTDFMRAPLAAALVTVMDSATHETVVEVYTDGAGRFTFDSLAAGVPYLIAVRRPGFIQEASRAKLRPGDTLNVQVVLVPVTGVPSHLRGTVTDSMRAPLAAALVTVMDSATREPVGKGYTDSAGRFTFDSLSSGMPYLIAVRRPGFIQGMSSATLRPGDTLKVQVVLASITVLAPVRVIAKADLEYHGINADEIAKANVPLLDSYDIVWRLRPLMLGDPYKGCMEDPSNFTFGPPRFDDTSVIGQKVAALQKKVQDPRKFTLGIGSWGLGIFKNGGVQVYQKDPNSTDKDGVPQVDNSYPFHLYINGVLHDGIPGAKNILSQIPVDDIQEMDYIDCLDTTTPQYRNSLMITLKPGRSY